jgi:hypothetical protein
MPQGFFGGEFLPPSDKKQGLVNPTNEFLRLNFFFGHILKKRG